MNIEKKKMLKITVDTNTLISASIANGNEFKLLKLVKLGKIELVLSLQILKEFKEVILRAKFGFSQEQVINALKQIIDISTIIMPFVKIDIIKDDSSDNMILECAESAKVEYIVSGDKHLLNLKKYKDIEIVTTRFILEKLETYKY